MSTDPLVGHVLDGRYEISSRIARGGMATVYRAQDLRLGRLVAVKVMHEGLDPEFARRFDQEAKAAARLVNPHVVSVFDQGTDAGRPYIVMEYVPGCTLRHVVTREAPLDPLRALDLIEPLVSALASAHDEGLVHRDVKPENVLISDRGQIKVADFGLARAVSHQTVTVASGLLVGTVSYIPPELVTKGRADERSDIYSTGIVLFEMLTGRKPHTGESPIQVAWAHVHDDVPRPSEDLARRGSTAASAIPAFLDAIVGTCTSRDPRRRPADGRALLSLVRHARAALVHDRRDDPVLARLQTDPTVWTSSPTRGRSAALPVDRAPAGPTPEPGVRIHARSPRSPVDWTDEDRRRMAGARPAGGSRSPAGGRTSTSTDRRTTSPAGRQPWAAPAPDHRRRSAAGGATTGPTHRPGGHRCAGAGPGTRPSSVAPVRRLAQDPVHRRRRGALLVLVVVVLAVLCAVVAHHLVSPGTSAAPAVTTTVGTHDGTPGTPSTGPDQQDSRPGR